MEFDLDSNLKRDCMQLGRFSLCRLLLMNDKQYPWFILVPEVAGLTELYELSQAQRQLLMEESCYLSERLATLFNADKMNIAAIGNLVPQLHIHHVVRYRNDIAWPGPIWGKFSSVPYSPAESEALINKVTNELEGLNPYDKPAEFRC